MNSTDFTGSIATSTYSSFLSILVGVLFVSSHTTKKSNNALWPTSSNKNDSTACLISFLVNSSFGSNINGFAIWFNCCLKNTTNLDTFILSSADDPETFVKFPKFTIPAPEKKVIGLTFAVCNASLVASVNDIVSNSPVEESMYPTELALSTIPLLVPAGANHGNPIC